MSKTEKTRKIEKVNLLMTDDATYYELRGHIYKENMDGTKRISKTEYQKVVKVFLKESGVEI